MSTDTFTAADPLTADLESDGSAERRIDELSEEAYRARPEWSVSAFKMLAEPEPQPELFWGRYIAKLPDFQMEPSPQMQKGTAIHDAILQGRDINVIPREVLSSNVARQGNTWKQFAKDHEGEVWLKEDEAAPMRNAIASVFANSHARKLLELEGQAEHALFWTDEYTGLRLRGRIDRICKVGNGVVIDLKTAANPDYIGFSFACLDHKYHIQAATYMYAYEQVYGELPEEFVFIVVQLDAPYKCIVYRADREMLELGYIRMKEALTDLKARLESGNWYGPEHNRVISLSLPKKAFPM